MKLPADVKMCERCQGMGRVIDQYHRAANCDNCGGSGAMFVPAPGSVSVKS